MLRAHLNGQQGQQPESIATAQTAAIAEWLNERDGVSKNWRDSGTCLK